MRHLITLAMIAGAAVLVGCTGKKTEETKDVKSLVLYYSQEGTTKAVAEEIARLTGADIEGIEVTEPYNGSYDETIQRCLKEREEGTLPTLQPMNADLADYDVIYLGYPIWFGTFAPPAKALIDGLSLEGKKVVPFCSFGSGGLEASVRELRSKFPNVEILDGYGVRAARKEAIPQEVDRFLKENGLIEGEVEVLPEYPEQQPVGEEEKAIFDIACGNYMFPLGTPISFSKREVNGTTDYKFTARSQSPDGSETQTVIYVVAKQEDDMITAEFTKVVR